MGWLQGVMGVRRSGWKLGPDFSMAVKILWASGFSLVKQNKTFCPTSLEDRTFMFCDKMP